ncbi:MAG: lipoate--protein ligase family protein [candidate division KSB1 bacterium]|nr:lipoate--protein ligase family protein [candidate division KSB1 bacterium]
MHWRFLDTGGQAGDYNMALDAAMTRGGFCVEPTLRVFHWQPSCISIGYHQKAEEIDLEKCQILGIEVVRRPTGGGAILHAQELTYSVIIPATHPWFQILPLDLYRRLGEAIAAGLRRLGVDVSFAPGERLRVPGRPLRTACFASAGRNELLAAGKKIVGSAQRRFRQGTLQHGSVLIDEAHRALPDFLTGSETAREAERRRLADYTTTLQKVCRRRIAFEEVALAMRRGFAETLRIDFRDAEVLPEEISLAHTWRERFRILKQHANAVTGLQEETAEIAN